MSDNYLCFIPSDPQFQPSSQMAAAAEQWLALLLPQADSIEAKFFQNVTFCDPGMNWSGVKCPMCGADAEIWWGDAMDRAAKNNFASLFVTASCCAATVSLNELHYIWPAAFGRFVLEVMNPNIERLSPQQLSKLAAEIGHPLKEVVRRYEVGCRRSQFKRAVVERTEKTNMPQETVRQVFRR